MENEHKEPGTVDETMDKFFASQDAPAAEAQPEESSPQNVQPAEGTEGGSDPQKTLSTPPADEYKGVPEGFRNHPSWMAREAKLKEAREKAEELERSNSVYSKLLDDPLVYKKFLEAQGFDKETVENAMREKGFEVEPQQAPPQAPAAQDIASDICKELGWDISRLNAEQKAYINDQISLIQKVAEKYIGKTLDSRLKPMESYLQSVEQQKRISTDYDKAKAEAKQEFPDLDWEKDIEPAMARYLDELDKKDPKGTIRIDAITLYERATRTLLKEKRVSEERQEARDTLRQNSRPLQPRAPFQKNQGDLKGKTVKETADKFLDSVGMKN